MGRIRTIKPEFHAHEELSALPAETHLLAGALTNYADDYGYFNANPGLVKAGTHPLRKDSLTTEQQLAQLEAMGYIEIRSCADGKVIGKIVNFSIHQKVSHPSDSKLEIRFNEGSRKIPEPSLKPQEVLGPEQGTGNRELKGNRVASTAPRVSASPAFITFALGQGKTHIVTEADIASWEQAYPAVDVRQELRRALVWLDAHPDKRSNSIAGSKQRIVRWLGRSQDNGGTRGITQQNRTDAATERQRTSQDNIRAAAARRYGVGGVDGPGTGVQAEPNASSRDAGPVSPSVGGDSPDLRDGAFQGRTLEGVA